MNHRFSVLICVLGCTASSLPAQLGAYLGPGVLSRGAGDVGTRSGQQVDLRFYGDVSGVYDTGLQPFALDSKGNLITINGLYGIVADVGAYGTHSWRQAALGLDYAGNFTHYTNGSFYDNTNQNLRLGYTYQKSRRVSFDFRENAGISKFGYGSPGFYTTTASPTDFVTTPTALLFDNRFYYFQTTMDMSYLQSARTIYTVGGDGFWVRRQASGLAGTNGYNLRGSVQHRVTKRQTIGGTYQHLHFDFPPAFGQSDVDVGELFLATGIGRRWTLSVSAGALLAQIQGIEQVALDPVLSALFGTGFSERAFFLKTVSPSGRAALEGHFKSSSVAFSYAQQIVPGNGVYLTSVQKGGSASYSYNGIRNWSLGLSGGYMGLKSLGQGIQPYNGATGAFSATYRLTGALHAVARFEARNQQIEVVGYKHTGYRATIGLAFSPGDLPLSLW